MISWRFLPLETRNGYWNMAIDEAILKAVIEKKVPHTLRFYKWKPSTVSIGRNQSISTEVDRKTAEKKGFNIVRRITGGGAVFHDEFREITYSLVCPIKFLENLGAIKVLDHFEIITQSIIAGLRIFGLEPQKGIIHCPALLLDGKKFSGNAQTRRKNYLLQHGTILLDINPELMYSVLTPPENVTKTKMVQSVRAKCVGIKKYFENYEENKFIKSLLRGFEQSLKINTIKGKLTEFEIETAKKLMQEKYERREWLYKYP
ncbi:MAG: lipoate--protein ligase family protein [Candidatus Lokiarchaeota archaeon]|nr:lipoate--protein ligase family protein [Candidatus Lokiarchaeota archaeon]MBD3339292.1 lipoate--protein ligase family protein [Candidatus Lokiarchaeota archaeon]